MYVLASLLVRSGVSLQAQFAAVPRAVDLPGLDDDEFGPALARAVANVSGRTLVGAGGNPDIVVAIGNAPAPGAAQLSGSRPLIAVPGSPADPP